MSVEHGLGAQKNASALGESFELAPGVLHWSEVRGYGCGGDSMMSRSVSRGFVCDLTAPATSGKPLLENACGSSTKVADGNEMKLSWANVFLDRESPIMLYELCLHDTADDASSCDSDDAVWTSAGLATSWPVQLPRPQ